MTTCPVCQAKVNETAKFCNECGVQLTGAASERAWVIAMQENIRSIRHNDVTYNVIAVVGILIAVAVPFLMRYVLHFDMDMLSWILTAVGVVFFIISAGALWYDESKVKKLIEELKQGQPYEEEIEESSKQGGEPMKEESE